MGKYFGTDGIRGRANEKLTPELALKVGQALGVVFRTRDERRHRVVIGKDTRLSGYMIGEALVAGLTSVGMDAIKLGPMPTGAVAILTREMRADVGIMITASHNLFEDNGIKIFRPDGYKLSDEVEARIEEMLDPAYKIKRAESGDLGRAAQDDTNRRAYVQFAKMTVRGLSLEGLRIVVDCANGAGYKSAPEALWELGAEVIKIGCDPDGFNINRDCGSTDLRALKEKVKERRADVGIAFDGDGDRVIFVDENGKTIDGDQILAVLAGRWKKQRGRLRHSAVVGTVMSNIGLERYLRNLSIALERTAVGDHHVFERMRAGEYVLGGEPSGHIIMQLPNNFGMIGDGLITALHVLSVLRAEGRKASEALRCFDPVLQTTKNVEAAPSVLEHNDVISAIEECRRRLEGRGRLVVRPSGTEPVIRIMIECDDVELAEYAIVCIKKAIKAAKL